MTDREKIIEIIKKNGTYNGRSLSFDYYVIQPDDLADALSAAGIGDVKRHRVFVSKDGTEIKQLYSGEEVERIAKERDEYKHRTEVAERALKNALNNDTCYFCNEKISCRCEHRDWGSDECIKSLLQQAEKELEEEGKE